MKLPTNQELDALDMEQFAAYIDEDYKDYFRWASGKEHYRLLFWLSDKIQGPVYDIGTHRGMSSLALSGMKSPVISYDINPQVRVKNPWVDHRVKNPLEDIDEIAKAGFVMYDTTHDGHTERQFFRALCDAGFSGTILFDDIHLNKEMESFWADLVYPQKYDITGIGHGSGTGVLVI
jgi:hypothetical protein